MSWNSAQSLLSNVLLNNIAMTTPLNPLFIWASPEFSSVLCGVTKTLEDRSLGVMTNYPKVRYGSGSQRTPAQAAQRDGPKWGRPASARARPGAGNQSGTKFQPLPAIVSANFIRNASSHGLTVNHVSSASRIWAVAVPRRLPRLGLSDRNAATCGNRSAASSSMVRMSGPNHQQVQHSGITDEWDVHPLEVLIGLGDPAQSRASHRQDEHRRFLLPEPGQWPLADFLAAPIEAIDSTRIATNDIRDGVRASYASNPARRHPSLLRSAAWKPLDIDARAWWIWEMINDWLDKLFAQLEYTEALAKHSLGGVDSSSPVVPLDTQCTPS
jgi:hypothetical protein